MSSSKITDIPGLNHCWKVGNLFLAGQPPVESFDKVKEHGVQRVFNLRGEGEDDFSAEEKKCKELGLEYHHIPIVVNGALSKENCAKLSSLMDDTKCDFIHCVSANRVNGWFITYLVQNKNVDLEEAIDLAMTSGLTNPGFIAQAEAIIDD